MVLQQNRLRKAERMLSDGILAHQLFTEQYQRTQVQLMIWVIWCPLIQWSRSEQKDCIFCLFFQNSFLSDYYEVAPPNTSSTTCIVTAFGGLCGGVVQGEGEQGTAQVGRSCTWAPGWLKQGAENWRTIPALWLNHCQERRYHCASMLWHGAVAMQVSACVSGKAEREKRPRPSLYYDLKTGKFSETELNRWLREPTVITVACYKHCSVHVGGERPFILAINQ